MYLDPNMGSMLIQIIGALVISAGVVLGMFRKKIFTFFQEKKIAAMKKRLEAETKKRELGK